MDGSSGPGGTWSGVDDVTEANEADAQEQRQEVDGDGSADTPADPEAAVGTLSGRDLDAALMEANEADLVEQAQEVPYDDDFDR
ncbi:MAG: hypothetical protein ACXV3S_02430 [Kineosporiaceae bacterium]